MKNRVFQSLKQFGTLLLFLALVSSCRVAEDEPGWLRGNMHTHTFWSDGDDFPEPVAKWYKDNGYDFLVFTDHNILLNIPVTGQLRGSHVLEDDALWQRLPRNHPAVDKYTGLFGEDWVEMRPDDDGDYLQVRLKALDEFRDMFEEPERFLLMMGNEITDQHAVHMLAFHQDEIIPTVGGNVDERARMIREITAKVDDYRRRTGRNTHAVLAHPNFRWAITAEMMLEAGDLRYFELYNGHPSVNNEGDEFRASSERMWDIVLSMRLGPGNGKILYGLATDDAHRYHSDGATPGRGWVMVRSPELEEGSILDAIDSGDFYSSTGVVLREINFDGKQLNIEIEPQEGVTYTTEYIGTLSGFDTSSKPTLDGNGDEIDNTTRSYSEEIGVVLASSNDLRSGYTLTGDELYVRARVISSADQADRITGNIIGKQTAWVQPVVPGNSQK
jgi:hypothetical protein